MAVVSSTRRLHRSSCCRQPSTAIGDRAEVLVDGGIRRGADIVKAVAMGATACMVGRAYLYGLGAAGERGVDKALGFLHDETERTMKLIGAATIDELGPDYIQPA